MYIRVLSAMIGLVLLLTILFSGGVILYLSAIVVTLIGLFEYNKANGNEPMVFILNSLFMVLMFATVALSFNAHVLTIIILYVITMLSVALFRNVHYKQVLIGAFGFLYVGLLMLTIIKIYEIDSRYLWYIFLISFMTDTSAYFCGSYFGKHKLFPSISPNKTIEGSVGGVIGCVFSGMAFSFLFFPPWIMTTIPLVICGSIMGQIGDLVASKFKREAGLKDFGTIMPGHGGMLDRFDSILFVAPVVYFYLLIVS